MHRKIANGLFRQCQCYSLQNKSLSPTCVPTGRPAAQQPLDSRRTCENDQRTSKNNDVVLRHSSRRMTDKPEREPPSYSSLRISIPKLSNLLFRNATRSDRTTFSRQRRREATSDRRQKTHLGGYDIAPFDSACKHHTTYEGTIKTHQTESISPKVLPSSGLCPRLVVRPPKSTKILWVEKSTHFSTVPTVPQNDASSVPWW
jgi:hypothetical protein